MLTAIFKIKSNPHLSKNLGTEITLRDETSGEEVGFLDFLAAAQQPSSDTVPKVAAALVAIAEKVSRANCAKAGADNTDYERDVMVRTIIEVTHILRNAENALPPWFDDAVRQARNNMIPADNLLFSAVLLPPKSSRRPA